MIFLEPLTLIPLLWLGWLLDRLLAEPGHWHPLVGFGNLASWMQSRFNRVPQRPMVSLISGCLSWALLILPILFGYLWIYPNLNSGWLVDVSLLYLALGGKSLVLHIQPIQQALKHDDLPDARSKLSYIVSRETEDLNREQISSATVESILENSNDAIYAALFWFALAGAPGVLLYRLSNTLDAMWGYRNPRFEYFGKFAARMDDLLNVVPAWLTACWFSMQIKSLRTIKRVWFQGLNWKSPNAGLVMASGAASIGVQLGGAATYHGQLQLRPVLGYGEKADLSAISRALARINMTAYIWLIVLSGVLYGLA